MPRSCSATSTPTYFAGGTLRLDPTLARDAIERAHRAAARAIGVSEAALGIHRVVNAQMAEGIRLVSIRRGVDPRGFALMPLGGGGALHATALADELGIDDDPGAAPSRRAVAPRACSSAAIEHEVSTALSARFAVASTSPRSSRACTRLDRRCAELMRRRGSRADEVDTRYFADVCYVGQAYHLEVPLDLAAPPIRSATLYGAFCARARPGLRPQHRMRRRGSSTCARCTRGGTEMPMRGAWRPAEREPRKGATRGSCSPARETGVEAAVYDRAGASAGLGFAGPAIIEQADTTTLVEPGWQARLGPTAHGPD